MHTEQRLTQVYNNADIEYFDDESRIVLFSDCHRGIGNLSDEFTKNQNLYFYALEQYYKEGYRYIEAGDGDELWEHKKFADIKNAHYYEFELLRKFHEEDRLTMLYGNHNIYLKKLQYVQDNYFYYYNEYLMRTSDLFKGIKPKEAVVLKHKNTGQEFLVVHGHQGDFANDQIWRFTMFSSKYIWRYLHAIGLNNPSSPVKNMYKLHKIEKNFTKWIEKHKVPVICGHTHRLKFPRESEVPYFNIGCCVYPTSITAIEIDHGKIKLVRWRVAPDSDGILRIVKNVMRGPEKIEKFDIR